MENTTLTSSETNLLVKIAQTISEMTEFEKGYLLGMAESKAKEQQEEEKKAG